MFFLMRRQTHLTIRALTDLEGSSHLAPLNLRLPLLELQVWGGEGERGGRGGEGGEGGRVSRSL